MEIPVQKSYVPKAGHMEAVARPRVLLADDHESVLARTSAIHGRDAIAEAQRLDPDVPLIDVSMPILDGLQAASQLQSIGCTSKVVFLAVHDDKDFVAEAFFVGASGYVSKSRMSTDLIPAIREVLRGHTYVSQSIPLKSR